ncbi:MAG: tRNA uridine-5-carboxymethylaminomethyl(34) synthesis enzyme MnmG [Tenericutes bacterium]|jgi:tRNA uridine 5-carboxymethylaminomethyl modification enzyme|nr:tRNA uridine-5-carboxymethylaminomethyl(34) synthesis enzyme MnmG [Mycoplasmatota bacterium]
MIYDIIIVGGGHAGCEAALISARKKKKTLLVTSNIKNIADMPCNPSLGGPAKGIVIREIDALGGEMGKNADKSMLQIKMLNTKKGPAVQALRAQIDKIEYAKNMINTLKKEKNLQIEEGMVEDLIIHNEKVEGIILSNGKTIKSKIVILTTGTYLKSQILIGDNRIDSGPHNEKPVLYLSDNLKKRGFEVKRLKTGTPPRIKKESIDFSKMFIQEGDKKYYSYSFDNKYYYCIDNQQSCYLTYTNKITHDIIKDNLSKSSMYGGHVEGVGPRYCPSIEDKVVRFEERERHQLFLEPESLHYDDFYLQGLSTSMPHNIQEKLVKSVSGLENAQITKYAYAIEYDAFDSLQLQRTLESKLIKNLYLAGQINGTSGYEEAACQGLIAGINAVLNLENKEPLILNRNQAYIGVLIDDLVTKGIIDPYRLLTSRAEYRLLLRNDNADLRLMEIGFNLGLVPKIKYDHMKNREKQIKELEVYLKEKRLNPTKKVNNFLQNLNSALLKDSIALYELLKRPEITIKVIEIIEPINFSDNIKEQVEINIKYEGYITKALKEADKLNNLERTLIPESIDYNKINNLASEARQKLSLVKPTSIGQALRISGVNPADISILMVYIKKIKHE